MQESEAQQRGDVTGFHPFDGRRDDGDAESAGQAVRRDETRGQSPPIATLNLFRPLALPIVLACGCLCACSVTAPPLLSVAKLIFSCLPEGTRIDAPGGDRAIEDLRAGDLVVGYAGNPVKILQIHAYAEDPGARRFHRVTFANGAVVELCDRHRVAGRRADRLRPRQALAGTAVARVETFGGVARSYDLLTEDRGYRIQGIPVNSMIEEMHRAARR
jgi:hypothetical protein